MGSRKAGDYSKFAGKGEVSKRIKAVREAIESNKPTRIIVGTAVNVIGASQPTIGTLIATYRLSKWAYGAYQKAQTAYNRTGDPNEAAKEVARETVKYAVATVRDEVISDVVDVGWGYMKEVTGIKTNELQDRILRAATKSTLDEELPK